MVKRGNTKGVLSVTIDNSLLEKFKKICKDNSINKSQLIESLINKYMENKS
jgi:metal-responsive CopG/Arc/MetJ family transcriptional regulator